MHLRDDEKAWAAGEAGPGRQWAIRHQVAVGQYLGAEDLVPVTQAHIMADTEFSVFQAWNCWSIWQRRARASPSRP